MTDKQKEISYLDFKKEIHQDYYTAVLSRECSLMGRREVLTGKAKFGIFGAGKELAQIAWAKAFKKGDFRSGYYRDQTFMMALGELNPIGFFNSLYAVTDIQHEPMAGGRQMNGHFATRSLDEDGNWIDLTQQYNSSSDISPTAGQMPRLLGLAQASKVYKEVSFEGSEKFSNDGNEVAWGTIGNASTSEGLFFETINAAGVLQVPMVISIWDDEYGISVGAEYQTTKEDISEILKGFQRDSNGKGYDIYVVEAWDYPALINTFTTAGKVAREEHVPVMIHVKGMTQPQGHSTSGSHERYKSKERLEWEKDHDCILKFGQWIIEQGIASQEELDELTKRAKTAARDGKKEAWNIYQSVPKQARTESLAILKGMQQQGEKGIFLTNIIKELESIEDVEVAHSFKAARKALRVVRGDHRVDTSALKDWLNHTKRDQERRYGSHLYSENPQTDLLSKNPATYSDNSEVDARVVLRDNFDALFEKYPETMVFGEDSGKIGDVNQGLEGMQAKYGATRVADAGIREATIMGQGIGLAMRGLRPIAEIQYLDYLLYALQIMSDDLATVHYRTVGGQKAPTIVRTRGHRLEGIWHSGSPMGTIINSIKGMYVLVPRNMTVAAGFYNKLLQLDNPALVIECLNGYRRKEKLPNNLGEFTTPIGEVEVLKEGEDVTVLTYGSNCFIAEAAVSELATLGVSVELIDAQSLIPFDTNHDVVESLKKTNTLVIIDEDVRGGASAFLMQNIIEDQGGYRYLDSLPKTISSKDHRPAFASDGDYFSKPSLDDMVEEIYSIMNEKDPERYPAL
ncbi:MAG: alpha-ketoacid dehydrogenase subunit alpha/beta [Schleiferiaceae bacterium]|jgi:pyruvate/2-oxoglutarate/acetoin dehydrogenase E1 component/TPP-dependent pyruvate/acetoin dehydrogenase alpha subunit